jgi:hypothetical protein
MADGPKSTVNFCFYTGTLNESPQPCDENTIESVYLYIQCLALDKATQSYAALSTVFAVGMGPGF